MSGGRRFPVLVIAFMVALGLVVSPGGAIAGTRGEESHGDKGNPIRLSPIGKPSWKPVDLHLFSAPIGTQASGYAEFGEQQGVLLPSPNHEPHPALGIGPGIAHPPPYNKEFRQGIRGAKFHEGSRFADEEFSDGNGVWLVWMSVAAPGKRGSSPDFRRGPIIPNSLFPVTVSGSTARDGAKFSADFTFDVPKLDQTLDPPFDVDGHSHFPVFFADNRDFGPDGLDTDPSGRYRWHMTMVDASGSGWAIDTTFVVGA